MNLPYLDPILQKNIPKWRKDVLKKDKDKVFVVDGREGSGKSVLAQQLAIHLDPNFNIDNIAFNDTQFLKLLRDPKRKKGDCIILDEAFFSANSRSAMSSVNKSMVGISTEMRQLNLFIIMVLPTFFDLDKYFALWRTDNLIHVYFDKEGDRGRYTVFNNEKKKQLYLKGKKFYNYGVVRSGLPPLRFNKGYVVDEEEYRRRKQEAFRDVKQKDDKHKREKLRLIEWCRKQGYSYPEIAEGVGKTANAVKKEVYAWGDKGAEVVVPNNNNITYNDVDVVGNDNDDDENENRLEADNNRSDDSPPIINGSKPSP